MPRSLKSIPITATLLVAAFIQGCASEMKSDPAQSADADVKQLLVLMDKDKSGTVSKQEFMQFMEAEFDRLDTDKNGVLDVNELTQLHVKGLGVHK